jgi:hypothetical protein
MPALGPAARRLNVPQQGYEPLRPIKGRPPHTTRARRFVAKLTDANPAAANAVDAPDFLQAALTFAETCAGTDATTLNIAVTDAETGETHCFTLSLD